MMRVVSVMIVLGLGACGEPMPKAVELGNEAKSAAKIDDEALARRKAEREAKQKAEEEAQEHLRRELARLCVVPEGGDKPPSCEEVSQAHDAFVRRLGDEKMVGDWDGGEKDEAMAMTVVQCTQSGSGKVAACQKHALDNAGKELAAHADELLDTCIRKFGKAGGDPGAVPIRPAG